MKNTRRVLGKGLNALIKQTTTKDFKKIVKIPVNKVHPNKYQPRKTFKDHSIEELAHSIKEHGLTQPVVVSHNPKTENYELIAGERRLRACRLAGLKYIDAIVHKNTKEKHKLAVSLVENIQREDLNPIDTASAFRQLVNHFGIKQNELARYCGKSKAAVSNILRLLELEDYIKKALQNGVITEGHARTLLSVAPKERRKRLFEETVTKKLTVRDLEKLAKTGVKQKKGIKSPKSADIVSFENKLKQALGTKVEIFPSKKHGCGKMAINYHSFQELDKITEKLI